MVIKDGNGNIKLAAKEVVNLRNEAKVAEALALRSSLQLAQDTCFFNLEAKSDCLTLIKALGQQKLENTYFGMIVVDCKHLSMLLNSYSFSYVSRDDNKVAHYLAKYPLDEGMSVWVDQSPQRL